MPLSAMSATPNPQSQRGFSLLEVLVAVLLISFALLGLVSLQARTVQLSNEAEDMQRASLLAGELASAMWSFGSVNLPADQIEAWQARASDPTAYGLPGGEGSVAIDGDVARISVSWTPPRSDGASSVFVTDVMLPVQTVASAPSAP